MAKDHIIPQAYIRQFATSDKQKLFYYSKNKWNKKVEVGSPGKICYGHEYYFLSPDTSAKYNVAASYLDKKLLKEYEDSMPAMFAPLLSGASDLPLENARFVSRFIVILKMRSGFFRSRIYNGNNVENALNRVIDQLLSHYPNSREDILQTKELLKEKLADPKSAGYLHSTSLYSLLNGERDEFFNRITDAVLNHRWKIINAPKEVEFISSDNPGFFCTEKGEILNTYFEGSGIFTFPISSRRALQIDFAVTDSPSETNKSINSEESNAPLVSRINIVTCELSEKYVYGQSKEIVVAAITQNQSNP